MIGRGVRALTSADAATFAGVTYDLNRSYTDRDGDVWFFEDTISAEDGTWHMSSSSDGCLNSLADVVLHWGPLKPHGHRPHDCAPSEPACVCGRPKDYHTNQPAALGAPWHRYTLPTGRHERGCLVISSPHDAALCRSLWGQR